jgi:hypothetical protein
MEITATISITKIIALGYLFGVGSTIGYLTVLYLCKLIDVIIEKILNKK